MDPALTHLAQNSIGDTVTPGLLGFLVIAFIATALYFLMKSMRRNLGRVDFETPRENRENTGDTKSTGTPGAV